MKRYLLLGLASAFLAGSLVTVTPTQAEAFTCYARASWGYNGWARGWASSASHARARGRALAQCYARTPAGVSCHITGCRWR
jgi:hypothetical protein